MTDQIETTATAGVPAVATQGLTKRFGRITALDEVNFTVPAGTILGLLGPNGSGKTTLLSILAGFISPTSGTFQLLGQANHRLALARTGSLISRPLLWPYLSCRDNLRCAQGIAGSRSDPEEVERLLAVVGLDGGAASRKFSQCSTGMRQRLGIATALLGNPDLLLLDEPTAGLDPEGMVEIREMVRSLASATGRTIIMSSHLLHEVELTCDHYAIIFRGNLADQGPVAGPSPSTSSLQLETTDNAGALALLREQGWDASPIPAAPAPEAGQLQSLSVSIQPDDSWKVARDLAGAGIYPTLMRPTEPVGRTGTLEARYLAAVNRVQAGEAAESG